MKNTTIKQRLGRNILIRILTVIYTKKACCISFNFNNRIQQPQLQYHQKPRTSSYSQIDPHAPLRANVRHIQDQAAVIMSLLLCQFKSPLLFLFPFWHLQFVNTRLSLLVIYQDTDILGNLSRLAMVTIPSMCWIQIKVADGHSRPSMSKLACQLMALEQNLLRLETKE